MNDERSDELTREERHAYASLTEPMHPSAACEEQAVKALKSRGLIRRDPWLRRVLQPIPLVPRLAVAGAALALAFVLGVGYGKRSEESTAPEARSNAVPERTESIAEPSGAMMASLERDTGESWWRDDPYFGEARKPALDSEDEEDAFGDFPAHPLDGRPHFYSPKYR